MGTKYVEYKVTLFPILRDRPFGKTRVFADPVIAENHEYDPRKAFAIPPHFGLAEVGAAKPKPELATDNVLIIESTWPFRAK